MCVHLAEQDYAGSHQLPCLIAPYGGALDANTKGQKEVLWDYHGERKRNGGEVGMIKEYIIKIDEDIHRKDINGGYPLTEPPQELIRCKDCKYWDRGHTEECDNLDSICFHNGWCKPDWFCPAGEPIIKENG